MAGSARQHRTLTVAALLAASPAAVLPGCDTKPSPPAAGRAEAPAPPKKLSDVDALIQWELDRHHAVARGLGEEFKGTDADYFADVRPLYGFALAQNPQLFHECVQCRVVDGGLCIELCNRALAPLSAELQRREDEWRGAHIP